MRQINIRLAVGLLVAINLSVEARAITTHWTAGGATTYWHDAANWTDGQPRSGDIAYFGAAHSAGGYMPVEFLGNGYIDSLEGDGASKHDLFDFQLGGGTLTLQQRSHIGFNLRVDRGVIDSSAAGWTVGPADGGAAPKLDLYSDAQLLLGGGHARGAGALDITAGGTVLINGGSITATGSVFLDGPGIPPGHTDGVNHSGAALTFTPAGGSISAANLDAADGSTIHFTTLDSYALTGPLQLAGDILGLGNLSLDAGQTYGYGDWLTLIEYGGSVLDTFNGLPEGAQFDLAFDKYEISYQGGRVAVRYLHSWDPLFGDYNADGAVDQSDLTLVLAHWGATVRPEDWVNYLWDGSVDQNELTSLLSYWGAGYAPVAAATPVPEPASLTMLAMLVSLLPRRCARAHCTTPA